MLLYSPVFLSGEPEIDIQAYLYNLIRQRILTYNIIDTVITLSDDTINRDFLSKPQSTLYIRNYAEDLGADLIFVPEIIDFTQGYLGPSIITMRFYIMRTNDGIIIWDITSSITERSKDRYDKATIPVKDIRIILSNLINNMLNHKTLENFSFEE